jgi:hypothetical protein
MVSIHSGSQCICQTNASAIKLAAWLKPCCTSLLGWQAPSQPSLCFCLPRPHVTECQWPWPIRGRPVLTCQELWAAGLGVSPPLLNLEQHSCGDDDNVAFACALAHVPVLARCNAMSRYVRCNTQEQERCFGRAGAGAEPLHPQRSLHPRQKPEMMQYHCSKGRQGLGPTQGDGVMACLNRSEAFRSCVTAEGHLHMLGLTSLRPYSQLRPISNKGKCTLWLSAELWVQASTSPKPYCKGHPGKVVLAPPPPTRFQAAPLRPRLSLASCMPLIAPWLDRITILSSST